MIGTLDKAKREVTVVGAGISGMLAAYALDKKGYEVTLVEERAHAGGLIQTRRTEYGIAESAAHSLLATPQVVAFCEELGVELAEIRKDSRALRPARRQAPQVSAEPRRDHQRRAPRRVLSRREPPRRARPRKLGPQTPGRRRGRISPLALRAGHLRRPPRRPRRRRSLPRTPARARQHAPRHDARQSLPPRAEE